MHRVTPKKTNRVLELIAEGFTTNHAAKEVGISRMSIYRLRDKSPKFAAKLAAAIESGTDRMEDEMLRRAVDGTQKPVFHQGMICGHIQEYSDTLLIFMLKARRPAKFRDNQPIYQVDLTKLNDEQLRRLAAGEHPTAVLSDRGSSGVGAPATSEHIN